MMAWVSRAQNTCPLNSPGARIKHVIYIQFDNTHLRRDNPNVPSDLEYMPNLLNFIRNNGVLDPNHHAVLISHTADDILTSLMGVYGDRHGISVVNNYGVFEPSGFVVSHPRSSIGRIWSPMSRRLAETLLWEC
jgi:hypothetical protein